MKIFFFSSCSNAARRERNDMLLCKLEPLSFFRVLVFQLRFFFVKKAFKSRSMILWRALHLAYIRPHLEFAVQAQCPHLAGDIKTLEQIQHRATKTITLIKHFPNLQSGFVYSILLHSRSAESAETLQNNSRLCQSQKQLIFTFHKLRRTGQPIACSRFSSYRDAMRGCTFTRGEYRTHGTLSHRAP